MTEMPNYPENRLDIRIDENGNVTYQQNVLFAKYYAPTREEKEKELEELRDRLEFMEMEEPDDILCDEYDDWEEEKRALEEMIEDLEEEIEEMN